MPYTAIGQGVNRMSDMKLTNEKMLTFSGHEKIGTFKAGEKLTEVGEKQNIANELASFKKELDRVRLTEKLNSGAIERLDRAVKLAEGDGK